MRQHWPKMACQNVQNFEIIQKCALLCGLFEFEKFSPDMPPLITPLWPNSDAQKKYAPKCILWGEVNDAEGKTHLGFHFTEIQMLQLWTLCNHKQPVIWLLGHKVVA